MTAPVSGSGWCLEITRVADEDLGRLDAHVRRRVLAKIVWLRDHVDRIVPQPLSGAYRSFFKLRVGGWRIVYQIEAAQQIVTVHLIDRRDTVYKRL